MELPRSRQRLTAVLFALCLIFTAQPVFSAGKEAPVVTMKTNFGTITLKLDPEKAPKTVENFLRYVKEGFYDGTVFHRVIPNFMAQGGGFTADYVQKPTHDPVMNEADNGLENKRGTIAMARTGEPHSATAQFFINVVDNDFLNFRGKNMQGWGYTVFGEVVEGMDVVDKIKAVPTGRGGPFPTDVPQTQIVIEQVTVTEAAADKPEGTAQ